MDDAWLEIFRGLGISLGQGCLVLAIGYAVKSIYDNKLQQNLENYKNQLEQENRNRQLEMDKSFEEYRNQLEILKLENQIVFNKLHEQRYTIISKLYKKLNIVNTAIYDLTKPAKLHPAGIKYNDYEKVLINNTSDLFEDFILFYRDRKIYFSNELCLVIEGLASEIENILDNWNEKNFYDAHKVKGDDWAEAKELAQKDWQKVKNEIPHTLRLIESEFRLLLGVRSTPII